MIYKYEECDLFCVPSSYYLVQCISADFAMGAGTVSYTHLTLPTT